METSLYIDMMDETNVQVSKGKHKYLLTQDRKRKILDQSSMLAQSINGKTVIHEDLLDEVM